MGRLEQTAALLLCLTGTASATETREIPVDIFAEPREAFVRCAVAASFPVPIAVGQCDVPAEGWTSCSIVGGTRPATLSAHWTSANNASTVLKVDDLAALPWGKVFMVSADRGEVEVYDETWSCHVRVTKDMRVVLDARRVK